MTKQTLMTVKEAAHYLRLSTSQIRKLIFLREIGHLKFGKCVRFMKGDLDDWIQSKRRKPLTGIKTIQ